MERTTRRKVLIGVVTSDKMTSVVTVNVQTKMKHPLYRKLVIRDKKYHARDELSCKVGDRVEITETRKLAKTVNFRVSKIIERAK